MNSIARSIAVIFVCAGFAAAQHANHIAPASPLAAKPIDLISTDAITHRPVATRSKQAQAFFDQGLMLYYAFNDGDAVRSFRRAAEIDPQMAMAYWGIALAAYPRPTGGGNSGDQARLTEAREAVKTAMSIQAPLADRVYIEALSKLFADEVNDRGVREDDYRVAMKSVYSATPRDADASALYALSIFYSGSYSKWTPDGKPIGNTQEMVEVLESALKLHPKHLGLTHTYIHAVEESQQPEKALAAANALRGQRILIPSFGHLVHMPAHIYVRTGNFQASVESNEATATMPTDALSEEFKQWHYSHTLSFLLFSYSMQGNSAKTVYTLDRTAGFRSTRSGDPRPRYMVRFGRWADILTASAAPVSSRPNILYGWAWARTLAYIASGDIAKAEVERQKARSVGPSGLANVREIDEARLDAAFARAGGERKAEIEHLRKAVAAEDKLPYSEPPYSISPVRESLGGALLRDGQNVEAEAVFREDLRRNRGNGRSLFGLMTALEALGKRVEAQKVRKDFLNAWKHADIKLTVDML